MLLMVFTLVPRNSEITFCRSLPPGARDLAMVRTDIVQIALRADVSRTAGGILRICFYPNGPVRHIQENTRQRNGIRAWIDQAGDILAVPVHDDREVIPLGGGRSPVTRPRPRQRMAFLCERKKWRGETCRDAKQTKNSSRYHRSANISLYRSHRNVLTGRRREIVSR